MKSRHSVVPILLALLMALPPLALAYQKPSHRTLPDFDKRPRPGTNAPALAGERAKAAANLHDYVPNVRLDLDERTGTPKFVAARTGFLGLDYFPIDPAWRIEAKWVPFEPPREIRIASIVGTSENEKSPGKAVFDREGKTFELIPVQESPDSLFFIFSDETSGKETYGAARFLYSDPPRGGKVVLDFNRAVNPPCAFTPFATCPLPPKENRLTVRVTAGEKNYRGESEN